MDTDTDKEPEDAKSLIDTLQDLEDHQDEQEAEQDDVDDEDVSEDQDDEDNAPGSTGTGRQTRYNADVWKAIKADYMLGHLTLAALSAKYGPSDSAISRRANKFGWKRELSGDLARARNEGLIAETAGNYTGDPSEASIREAIDAQEMIRRAADNQIAVVREHRQDIKRLRRIADRLATKLENILDGEEKPIIIKNTKGAEIRTYEFLGTHETVGDLLKTLVLCQAKLIPLERQAFGLDKDENPAGQQGGIEERAKRWRAKGSDAQDDPKQRAADRRQAQEEMQEQHPRLVAADGKKIADNTG